MAKKKTTDDFDLDMNLPDIKRSQIADDKTINQAVQTVATVDGEPIQPKASHQDAAHKPKGPKTKTTASSKKEEPKEDEFAMLPKKRLTVDIPHYLNEALREYTYKKNVTTKQVIHDCLHDLLKVKAPK